MFFKKKKIEYVKKESLISSLAPKILTKKEDIEKIQPYLDKLNETIDTKGINNIALTGGYGSGKSTIIGTFKELNPQYEFLNISLASFNKKKSDNKKLSITEQKLQKEELERLLEVSILQQIFYHVKPDEIPESRFKRIINIPDWKIWSISIGFILWISSSILLLKYDYLDKINPNNWNTKDNFDWFALFIFIIAFIGLGLFSKLIIKLFSNSKINKVNIKGELELGDNVNKSVFNEHLEEILYFFERTKYDVVVIEDLDRFDSTDIFTKLREINILLNNSKLINREINFVYAVGDDLFNDKKERVKFFEYIIPVIPFINSSNADEQLRTLIKESGLDENIFTKEFISDVTTFIDDIDMRLLTNIFHEFVIFRKTLKPEFIKKNDELFAIITYKNLDPKDFVLLNKREGKLYSLINNKDKYIKEIIEKIDLEIQNIESEIKNIERHPLIDLNELNSIYLNGILRNLDINYRKVDIQKALSNFQKILDLGSIEYLNYYSELKQTSFDFSRVEKEINPNFTYQERVGLTISKRDNKIRSLKTEVEKLNYEKTIVKSWDLKQIFNEIEIEEYFSVFSNSKLLRNLILEGYINENYNDYISLFYEGALTKDDKKFEQNVKAQYTPDFKYKLTNIENLVERSFEARHYTRESILNFDLIDFLGKNYSKYSNKYNALIRLVGNEKETSIKFISEYIKYEERPVYIFISKLIEHCEGFVEFVFDSNHFSEQTEDKILELIIRHSNQEILLKNQNTKLLKERIENTKHFISLFQDSDKINHISKVTKLLIALDVKFQRLDVPEKKFEDKLLQDIYRFKLYHITTENILQVLRVTTKNTDIEKDFNTSNFSTILNSNYEPLIQYVRHEIVMYFQNIYLDLKESQHEEVDSFVEILNSELSLESKEKVIKKVETKVAGIWDVDELEVSDALLINNKLVPTWDNVIGYFEYFNEDVLNENLIKYLNFQTVYEELSKGKLIVRDNNKKFEIALIKCNSLTFEAYDKLLDGCSINWNTINFSGIDNDKAYILMKKRLNVDKRNYDLLKEHYSPYHINLIEKNYSKFIETFEDFEFSDEDILLLLKSQIISITDKFYYISKLIQLDFDNQNFDYESNENIISGNSALSKIVGEIVLLHKSEIHFNSEETIIAIIINTAKIWDKINLIVMFNKQLNDANLINLLMETKFGYEMLFKPKKPTYLKTEENRKLLNILLSRNLIKRFYDDKWSKDKYRVTTNY